MSQSPPLWDNSEAELDTHAFDDTQDAWRHRDRAQPAPAVCPGCQGRQLIRHDTSGRISALLGAMAGGISGGVKALEVAHPYVNGLSDPRLRAAALASAVTLGVLAGATTGCAAGAALGQRLDAHVLPSYCCLDCGHKFSK